MTEQQIERWMREDNLDAPLFSPGDRVLRRGTSVRSSVWVPGTVLSVEPPTWIDGQQEWTYAVRRDGATAVGPHAIESNLAPALTNPAQSAGKEE